MKIVYFGVFLLSVAAFPAAANRVLIDDNKSNDYRSDTASPEGALYCSDRGVAQYSKPRPKEGVIVKMKPFVVKEVINTETFKQ
ncbi:MAG: hypothetical protein VXZ58_08580 [Actinomycetota bacterium]|nr:hypothetical protein [Actinomycetota bacterium]